MEKCNALQIQEALKKQTYVTVPWLQLEYGLSYLEAKDFLQQLILRGWVAPQAEGLRYDVHHGHLCLRKIRRDEVDGLYADMTSDCVTVLNHLEKQGSADFEELEEKVQGDDDTREALQVLMDHRLIYQVEAMYYLAISKRAVNVIWTVDTEKRRTVMRRKMMDPDEIERDIKKLYNALFED